MVPTVPSCLIYSYAPSPCHTVSMCFQEISKSIRKLLADGILSLFILCYVFLIVLSWWLLSARSKYHDKVRSSLSITDITDRSWKCKEGWLFRILVSPTIYYDGAGVKEKKKYTTIFCPSPIHICACQLMTAHVSQRARGEPESRSSWVSSECEHGFCFSFLCIYLSDTIMVSVCTGLIGEKGRVSASVDTRL